jgi:hypothetical protein
MIGAWANDGSCSQACDTCQCLQNQRRKIVSPAANGGLGCSGDSTQSLPCSTCGKNTPPSPPGKTSSTSTIQVTLAGQSRLVDSGCPSDCSDNGLCLSNFYRKSHGAPALTYNKTLEGYAQQCVDDNTAGSKCLMEDCLTAGSGSCAYELETTKKNRVPPTACDAITAWYIEVNNYVFSKTPFTDNKAMFDDPVAPIGHFSQLVWVATTSMGCGYAFKPECFDSSFGLNVKAFFWNCNYWPSGNMQADSEASTNTLWIAQVKPLQSS